jgi:hypothetical protein
LTTLATLFDCTWTHCRPQQHHAGSLSAMQKNRHLVAPAYGPQDVRPRGSLRFVGKQSAPKMLWLKGLLAQRSPRHTKHLVFSVDSTVDRPNEAADHLLEMNTRGHQWDTSSVSACCSLPKKISTGRNSPCCCRE